MNILFICLGNICRSPMAEFIAKDLIQKNNIKDVFIDSAGLSSFHQGEDMHIGTKEILLQHNIKPVSFSSKPISKQLIDKADYILVMDNQNLNQITNHINNDKKFFCKITDYTNLDYNEVPDPWYTNNFKLVYDILTDSIYNFFKQKEIIKE